MLNKLQQKFLYMYVRFLLDKINMKEELLGCNLGKKDSWEKDFYTELAKISYLQGVWIYSETLLRTHFEWVRTIPCQSRRQSWCCHTSQVEKTPKIMNLPAFLAYSCLCLSYIFFKYAFQYQEENENLHILWNHT